jgi:hypothetical protein
MSPIIGIAKVFDRYCRVFLGRRQAHMSEKFLDLSQIGTHIEQMGCIAVPKSMGMDMLIKIRSNRSLSQYPTCLTSREPARSPFTSRSKRNKERFAHDPRVPPNFQPGAERATRLFRNRNNTFFTTLPHHANLARTQFKITHIQSNQLADANPGSIKQLDQRTVTQCHPSGTPLSVAPFRCGLRRNTIVVCDELLTIVNGKGTW